VTYLAPAEHFVRAPAWTWYILFYFFLAGLSGGSYAIASLLRLNGNPADEPAARVGFYTAFLTVLACPALLILDLRQPTRFWHMLVNTTPDNPGLNVKYWSPMSVGSWALVVFSGFVIVSFVDTLVRDRAQRNGGAGASLLGGVLGKLWNLAGGLVGLFIAGYTGVLLAVSNQPVWSDSWALGGLFLASALAGSAALLGWLAGFRRDSQASVGVFVRGEHYFQILELALIAVFAVTLIPTGTLTRAFGPPWFVLWAVALLGIVAGMAARPGPSTVDGGGAVAARSVRVSPLIMLLVLAGVLAMRAAIIFSAQ
jgi:formate-dependent nitrite reductase membrane component NrfD